MRQHLRIGFFCFLTSAVRLALAAETTPALLCHPIVSGKVTVATAAQRLAGGGRAAPPITDLDNGFAWPDTPMGVIRTGAGYTFFASDGGLHSRQVWRDHIVGNDKYGSIVATAGTLDNPLGSASPQDVSISLNPNPTLNPNYRSYGYMGGGPVYQVPFGMPGAGDLLATYHAALPNDALSTRPIPPKRLPSQYLPYGNVRTAWPHAPRRTALGRTALLYRTKGAPCS